MRIRHAARGRRLSFALRIYHSGNLQQLDALHYRVQGCETTDARANDVMIDGFGACYPFPSDGLHSHPSPFSAF